MRLFNYLKNHRMSVLSVLLVIAAAALGADCAFAMAVDPVEMAPNPNPSTDMNTYDVSSNPAGRPDGEDLQQDEQGGKTQLQGKAATATDVRDAGLEAEDYDKDVDEFRPFAFPIETYIARQCRPVKCNSPEHGHWRTGSTDLEAVFLGVGDSPSYFTIDHDTNQTATIGGASKTIWTYTTKILKLPTTSFDNPDCLTEFSTVIIRGVAGFKKDAAGNEIPDGDIQLFVLNHKDNDEFINFLVTNAPVTSDVQVPVNASFMVMATAGSESQMHVAPETFLPEEFIVYLQKKIETVVITDKLEEQIKKVPHNKQRILANAEYNFKRKCARSHWNGSLDKRQVWVEELNGREYVYMENGILRQLNMLYVTAGDEMTDNDLLAITTLQFTDNSLSDEATVFCGKKAMQRLIRLVNSADKYKDVGKVEVNDYGIKVRKYRDNFGSLDFIYDPTLNDIGYEEAMVVVDLRHATRPYIVSDKRTTRDMSKTGEAREAKEYNLVREDCVALNGFNSMLIIPSGFATKAANLGGIKATFESVSALPSGSDLAVAGAKLKKYVLTADDSGNGFAKGDVIEWDFDLNGWVKFQGLIRE